MQSTSRQLIGCTCASRRLLSSTASRRLVTRQTSSNPRSVAKSTTAPAQPAQQGQQLSAADYLRRQAELEEAEEASLGRKAGPNIPELRERAWDGDEPQERAIRRILEDTYKPLRVKGHKKAIPQPAPLEARLFRSATADDTDDPALIAPDTPANPNSRLVDPAPKNPWDYIFKAPISHQPPPASIKAIPRSRLANKVKPAERLAQAREKSLDFQAGFEMLGGGKMQRATVQVPAGEEDSEDAGQVGSVDMRNWEGFVEDRIQKAYARGLFDKIEGRGKPLPTDEVDRNPFVPREEAQMNRIIKSQDCVPPFVELQRQLEADLAAFRSTLGQDWVRRATRMLSLDGVTPRSVARAEAGYKDAEWEARERRFHEVAIKDVNNVVRRFNIIAPYALRRGQHSLEAELERTYRLAQPYIVSELRRRLAGTDEDRLPIKDSGERKIEGHVAEKEEKEVKETMWRAFKRVVVEVLSKGPDPVPVQRRA